jgi:pilus assembly protein CpaB
MKPVRIVVLAVAAVSAIGLAMIVRVAMSGKPTTQAVAQPVVRPKPTLRVLVARRDLKVGDRIADADIDWRAMPAETVLPAWITDTSAPPPPVELGKPAAPAAAPDPNAAAPAPRSSGATKQVSADGSPIDQVVRAATGLQSGGPKAAFIGAVVRETIPAGDPITPARVVRAGESGYLAVVLEPGKRAVSISVTVDSAAGGFILPGDRVDVILTRKLETGTPNSLYVSQTILQNMKVLAIDQTTRPDKDAAAVIGATATLEVTAREVEALAVSKSAGNLSLALRSYADAKGAAGSTKVTPLARIGGEGGQAGGGGPAIQGVKVYRNGVASLSPVSQ